MGFGLKLFPMKTLIIILALISFSTLAQDFSLDKASGKVQPNFLGQAKLIQGKTFKKVNGELKAIVNGSRFYPSDVVVTDKNSKVRIFLVDETSLVLGPESEIQFTSFQFKDKNDRQAIVTLVKGQLASDVKNEVRNGEITFKTRFVAMGVRGTELLVNHRSLKDKEISEFALLSGKADLTDQSGQVTKLNPGMKMVFIQDTHQKSEVAEILPLTSWEKTQLSQKVNEDKEFRHLLPYLDLKSLSNDSKLAPALKEASAAASPSTEPKVNHPSPKNHWKDNLRMLNERLKKDRQDEAHP